MYKLTFYVPEMALENVKQALFDVGAGKIGHYDHCCWQTKGEGQYRPLAESHPTRGEKHAVNRVTEYLVEMVCQDNLVTVVIDRLKQAHPYETPAYALWKLEGGE